MPDITDIYGGFDPDAKAEYLDDDKSKGCCGQTMKVWLIICNVILFILAVAGLGVGIWVQTQPAFAWTAGSIGVGLICLGVFLILISILGCIGAWKKSRCMLAIYATFLCIFFLAEFIALIVSIAATSIAIDVMNQAYVELDTGAKDAIGAYFGCCAVSPENVAVIGADGEFTTCNAGDSQLTNGESDPEDETTWTAKEYGGGVCQIFGLDHSVDGGDVEFVTFAEYNSDFLTKGSCSCGAFEEAACTKCDPAAVTGCFKANDKVDPVLSEAECAAQALLEGVCQNAAGSPTGLEALTTQVACTNNAGDNRFISAINWRPNGLLGDDAETGCTTASTRFKGAATDLCVWSAPEGAVCAREEEDIKGNTAETEVPDVCKCSNNAEENKECRQKKGSIPVCTSTEYAPYPFVVGLTNTQVNVGEATFEGLGDGLITAPVAACYSKFESWLADNLVSASVILGFIFVYQFIQMIFSFALCCGCCMKKGSDEAADGPSGI